MYHLRLAFLGVTHPHARAWADAAHDDPRVKIASVHDPDPEASRAFGERYGAELADSPKRALGSADAVVVDGRNDQAAAFAEQAVAARLPVFLEKTGARSAAELHAVAEKADRASLITQMGYFMRYSDAVARARDALAQRSLGTVHLARFHAAVPHAAWDTMRHWFADATNVVTPFMEAGCHLVDVVRLLLGEPHQIRAGSTRLPGSPSPAEDALAATMLCGDTVVTIDFTAHGADPWNIGWGGELFGDRSTLRFGVTPARTSHGHGGLVPEIHTPVPLDDADAVRLQMQRENSTLMQRGMSAFIESVQEGTASPVDAGSGAATLQLIEDIQAACRLPSIRPQEPHEDVTATTREQERKPS